MSIKHHDFSLFFSVSIWSWIASASLSISSIVLLKLLDFRRWTILSSASIWSHGGKTNPRMHVCKTEFHPTCNSAGFAKSVPDFEICAQSLNYFKTILHYFPSEQKFKEFSLFSSTFSKNSSFQGLFKRPWNLKLNSRAFQGLQGVARTLWLIIFFLAIIKGLSHWYSFSFTQIRWVLNKGFSFRSSILV